MLAIEVTLNILYIIIPCILFFAAGFLYRSSQLKKLKSKIIELEKEMLSNHAQILQLQKDKAQLEEKIKDSRIPVIPLKSKEDQKGGMTAEGNANQ